MEIRHQIIGSEFVQEGVSEVLKQEYTSSLSAQTFRRPQVRLGELHNGVAYLQTALDITGWITRGICCHIGQDDIHLALWVAFDAQ